MIRLVALLLVCAPALASADKTFVEGKGAEWDCKKDPVVSIVGNDAKYTVRGECKSISVAGNHNSVGILSTTTLVITGNENTVEVAAVDKISAPGNKNKVRYGKTVAAKTTAISNLGTDNSISAM